jgi:hypothetical protein
MRFLYSIRFATCRLLRFTGGSIPAHVRQLHTTIPEVSDYLTTCLSSVFAGFLHESALWSSYCFLGCQLPVPEGLEANPKIREFRCQYSNQETAW